MDWLDFVMGIGFAFVLEGVIWGLFPQQIIEVVRELAKIDVQNLRLVGVCSLALGVGLIWLVTSSRMAGG